MLNSMFINILGCILSQILLPFIVFIIVFGNIKIALLATIISELLLYVLYRLLFKKNTIANHYLNTLTYRIYFVFLDITIMTLISYGLSKNLIKSITATIISIFAVHLIGNIYNN